MKQLFFITGLVFLLSSCGQPSGNGRETGSERQTSKKVTRYSDTIKDGILKITPTGEDTVISLQDMKNEHMRAAQANYDAGVRYYNNGDLDNALSQFKSSLEYFPNNSQAAHYIARIYFEKGEKTLSLSYYEDAVRLNPEDSVSMLAIGQVYFDMRNFDKAMEYYDMTVGIAPKYGLAYYNRGTLFGMQKKYIPALDDLNLSIKLNPENPNAYLNRGLAYFYLENRDAACKDWSKASEMGLEKGTEAFETYCK
jgi:tetratricopeptide (TPR) repeat protein